MKISTRLRIVLILALLVFLLVDDAVGQKRGKRRNRKNRRKDGCWGIWGEWCPCDKTCGDGKQYRFRQCDNPPPSNGGVPCPAGDGIEARRCNDGCCPVNCKWKRWSLFTKCSMTCGEGVKGRYRYPARPASCGGKECVGKDQQIRRCFQPPCPMCKAVDCVWKNWSDYTPCSVTCGTGTQARWRGQDPPASCGGCECEGDADEIRSCTIDCCKDGVPDEWTPWYCVDTCGDTSQIRNRTCSFPPGSPNDPAKCTPECSEELDQTANCNAGCCPHKGIPSQWTNWLCVETCGDTTEFRNRTCEADPLFQQDPVQCPQVCDEPLSETDECDAGCCDHVGIPSEWTDWLCDESCADTIQSRNRTCENDPLFVQDPVRCPPVCNFSISESQECNAGCCPHIGILTQWTDWWCAESCGDETTETRNRTCLQDPDYDPAFLELCPPVCPGELNQTESCNPGCCPHPGTLSLWTEWLCPDSFCETTESRNRTCTPDSNFPQANCPPDCIQDDLNEMQECFVGACPQAPWCHSVLNPGATGGTPFDFLGIFESSSQQHISKIKMVHDTLYLRGFQMEFGAGYLAAQGSTTVQTLCEFAANEVIKEVIVETSPYFSIPNIPARITFITSLQSCTGGPEGTADTFTYSGQRLLYARGRAGIYFDQISFIFSRC